MLWSALAFCLGAAAIHALPSPWPPAVAIVPAVAAVSAFRRAPILAAGLAGIAWALYSVATALAGTWPCSRDRETVEIVGHIVAPAIVGADRTDFDLDGVLASANGPGRLRTRLSWYEADRVPRVGERWRMQARLRCPRGFANPGAPDRELALLREGVDATGYVAGERIPERLDAAAEPGIERLRERVAAAIARALSPGPTTAVLQGLSVGVRGNIPDRLWEAFAVTGLAHLVAISGLHVTGCALSMLIVLRLAWRWRFLPPTRLRPALEGIAVVAATAVYALLSGASVPALRTLAMVALFCLLRILRRPAPIAGTLAIAAAILVALDPLSITAAGFWLSFVATAALLSADSAGTGWRAALRGFTRAQVAIAVLLAPVLAATFGRLSIVAPLVNAVAIPLFSLLILPAVLLGTVITLFSPAASALLWQWLGAMLDGTWPALEWIAAWPPASFAPAAQPVALLVGAGVVAWGALSIPFKGVRTAAAVLLVSMVSGRAMPVEPGGFLLTVVDVGQGLAIVVETARHVLVFDTGPQWRGGTVAARVSLLPYLRARGIRRIDRLVLSHDDQDHAGGARLIARSLEIEHTLTPPGGNTSGDATCAKGTAWTWDGVAFRVLHPPRTFAGSDNERSCALRVDGSGGAALLLADPEAAAESALVDQALAADVVLIPHHGSASSSSQALVDAVAARVAIASAGYGNRWGMPRADVVARWRGAGTTVISTAELGAVQVRFSPQPGHMAIRTERRDNPHWWRAGTGR